MKDINGNWERIKQIEKDSGKSVKSVKVDGYYQTILEVVFYDYKEKTK